MIDKIVPINGQIRSLIITLAENFPVTGPPAAVLATIDNLNLNENGVRDVDQVLNSSRNRVLALEEDQQEVLLQLELAPRLIKPVPRCRLKAPGLFDCCALSHSVLRRADRTTGFR